ncbi:hypothetical protein LC607_16885 [Nostoc sp. CHAB 5824]|nr:hypothetical protein [Nostoc sp. CHAB 5824]
MEIGGVEVLESRVEVLKSRVEVLKSRIEVLKSRIEVLESRIEVLESRVEVLRSRVEVLRSRVEVLRSRVEVLQTLSHRDQVHRCVGIAFINLHKQSDVYDGLRLQLTFKTVATIKSNLGFDNTSSPFAIALSIFIVCYNKDRSRHELNRSQHKVDRYCCNNRQRRHKHRMQKI